MSLGSRASAAIHSGREGLSRANDALGTLWRMGTAPATTTPRSIRDALRACRPLFAFAALFGLGNHLMLLAGPIYALQIYDRILPGTSEQTLAALTLLVVAAYLMFGVVDAIRLNIITKVGVRLEKLLSERLVLAAAVPVPHAGRRSADPIAALDSCRGFFGGRPMLMLMDLALVPIFLALILMAHGLLGLFAIGAALLLIAIAAVMAVTSRGDLAETEWAAARIAHRTRGLIGAVRDAPGGAVPPAAMMRWREARDRWLHGQTRDHDRLGSFRSAALAASLAAQILALGLGAWLALRGEISPGGVLAASLLLTRTLVPLTAAIGIWRRLHTTRLACAVVDAALASSPDRGRLHSAPLPPLRAGIVIEGLGFRHPGASRSLIAPFIAAIPAGSFVGVVGDTGTGKSTLLRMLAGMLHASDGHATFDGVDPRRMPPHQLARHIGYMPQGDICLIDGTVRENIARLDAGAWDDAVSAAKRARVHETIMGLPQRYETRLGMGGVALSAGQRRRIGLARAFFGRPRVLLLDEPAANLDKAGEAALDEALAAAVRDGATILLATQRRDRLDAFDALLVLSRDAPPQFSGRRPRIDRPAPELPPSPGRPHPKEGSPTFEQPNLTP